MASFSSVKLEKQTVPHVSESLFSVSYIREYISYYFENFTSLVGSDWQVMTTTKKLEQLIEEGYTQA